MSFNPKRRYSAVALFSENLERVVLIHKLRPDWQAGKANLPGGKVELSDIPGSWWSVHGDSHGLDLQPGDTWVTSFSEESFDIAYRRCAVRELREETGLDIAAAALKLFCRLRYVSREGNAAECCFFAARGDVDAARTMEAERVFVGEVAHVFDGIGAYDFDPKTIGYRVELPTMPNLPYLVAMARQCLRGEGGATWPLTVYENGATLEHAQ